MYAVFFGSEHTARPGKGSFFLRFGLSACGLFVRRGRHGRWCKVWNLPAGLPGEKTTQNVVYSNLARLDRSIDSFIHNTLFTTWYVFCRLGRREVCWTLQSGIPTRGTALWGISSRRWGGTGKKQVSMSACVLFRLIFLSPMFPLVLPSGKFYVISFFTSSWPAAICDFGSSHLISSLLSLYVLAHT